MSDSFLSQEEIEALLSRVELEEPEPAEDVSAGEEPTEPEIPAREEQPEGKGVAQTRKVLFESLEPKPVPPKEHQITELNHVHFNVDVVLGETVLSVGELVNLKEDSIIVLDRLAGENASLLIDDRLLARGEVVVLNDCFALRINYQGRKKEGSIEGAEEAKTEQ